jgi:arginine deiminase
VLNPSADYGVHSEVGKLRKVLVCSFGLPHERLTPTNCDDLLFDDVLQNARRDHFDFMCSPMTATPIPTRCCAGLASK